MFEKWNDFIVPILRILAELPDGRGSVGQVMDLFFAKHRQDLPTRALQPVSDNDNQPQWKNKARWTRQYLIEMNFLDGSTRGIWRITQEGRDWLARNPGAAHVPDAGKLVARGLASKPKRTKQRVQRTPLPGGDSMFLTLFDIFEQMRAEMPPDQFREVSGSIHDRVLPQCRASLTTEVSDEDLIVTTGQPLRRIQDFLQGRGNHSPKSEEICDWILFCYTLELYREAAMLWQYVHQEDVDPWQYERIKKMAAVCRTRYGL